MVNYHGYEWSLWYDQEGTEGTSDTTATFLALAHKSELRISEATDPVAVALSGSVDNTAFAKGVSNITATISFNPSGVNGLAFIKNFASSDNSFTLVAKAGSIFQVLRGCKVQNISVTGSLYPSHGPVECTATIMAWTINGTEPTTAAYESIPTSFVNWSDVAITLAGSSITTWWNFSLSINNDLFRLRSNTGVTTAIHKGRRDVTCSVTRTLTDNATTQFAASTAATSTAAVFNFVSGTATFTLSAGAYVDVEVTHPISGMSGLKTDVKASTLSIS